MWRPFLPLIRITQRRHKSTHNACWLSEQKLRLGRLFFHGATSEETYEAGQLLSDLAQNWRRYVAGAEGYLISDISSQGHVNNVTYTRWAESARINWAWNLAKRLDPANHQKWSELWTPRGTGLILRSIKVDYKFPMEYPDRVSVYHKLRTAGEDHFLLDVIILSEKHQRVAARCMEDIVVYNYKPSGPEQMPGKAPIPPFMGKVFADTVREQTEASSSAREAMGKIDERIDALEKQVLARKEM
ncbi:thioesterase-like superfamily-domain-containing protein [Trichophaea hybrida]|nr:thioesterase-like superfamily-domain-containing protein [Trichophaea hybrida]